MCVCVCVREREREREGGGRDRDRETETETERDRERTVLPPGCKDEKWPQLTVKSARNSTASSSQVTARGKERMNYLHS